MGIASFFAAVESLVSRIVWFVARASTNPIGYFYDSVDSVRGVLSGSKKTGPRRKPQPFNPDRYRFPIGVMVLIVVLSFIFLIAWRLLDS